MKAKMKLEKDGSILTVVLLTCVNPTMGFTVGETYTVGLKDAKKLTVLNDNGKVVMIKRSFLEESGIFVVHQYADVYGKDWPSTLRLQLLSCRHLGDDANLFMFKETKDTVHEDGTSPSPDEEQILMCYHHRHQESVAGFWLADGDEMNAVDELLNDGQMRLMALISCGLT